MHTVFIRVGVPAKNPVGVKFEWDQRQRVFVTRGFVEGGKTVQKAGVCEGAILTQIDDEFLRGLSFEQAMTAMKDASGRYRMLTFEVTSERPPPPRPRKQPDAPPQTPTFLRSHSDPFSTPSRRRRVYLQVAQTSYLIFKREAIRRAIQWGLESAAAKVIQPQIRRCLAISFVERVRLERDSRCARAIQLSYRKHMARCRLAWLLAQRERFRRVNASIRIQQRVRIRTASKKSAQLRAAKAAWVRDKQHRAACIIQTLVRATFARLVLRMLAAEKARCHRAATQIQCVTRRREATRNVAERRRHRQGGVLMQRCWRGYRLKKNMRRHSAATTINSAVASWIFTRRLLRAAWKLRAEEARLKQEAESKRQADRQRLEMQRRVETLETHKHIEFAARTPAADHSDDDSITTHADGSDMEVHDPNDAQIEVDEDKTLGTDSNPEFLCVCCLEQRQRRAHHYQWLSDDVCCQACGAPLKSGNENPNDAEGPVSNDCGRIVRGREKEAAAALLQAWLRFTWHRREKQAAVKISRLWVDALTNRDARRAVSRRRAAVAKLQAFGRQLLAFSRVKLLRLQRLEDLWHNVTLIFPLHASPEALPTADQFNQPDLRMNDDNDFWRSHLQDRNRPPPGCIFEHSKSLRIVSAVTRLTLRWR